MNSALSKIGFMQGRLSPIIDGKIQCFPWAYWQNEFPLAEEISLSMMEWTIDQDRLYENPLMTASGQEEILALCQKHHIRIISLTGDCFMQAPFYKKSGSEREALLEDLRALLVSCARVGIKFILIPLVDAGRLENDSHRDSLFSGLKDCEKHLKAHGQKILFESDYEPKALLQFIDQLNPECFGINYDIGNSASLGFDPVEEISTYHHRIDNVHIKDRILGGTTVPLGTGHADLETVFRTLAQHDYSGNFILQTARSQNNQHQADLKKYLNMSIDWIEKFWRARDL